MNSILIIVNEPVLRHRLTSVLTEDGLEVADVADYPAALKILDKFSPDLAIIDEALPGGDGMVACSKIHDALGIPIIVMGKDFNGAGWMRAAAAGASFYFPKPLHSREIVARVGAIIRRYEIYHKVK